MKQVGLLHKIILIFSIFIVIGFQALSTSTDVSIAKAVETFEVKTSIVITSPQVNSLINKNVIKVTGVVSHEDISSLGMVNVLVDSRKETDTIMRSDGSWEASISLSEGRHEITATFETADNEIYESNSIVIMIDTIVPTGMIESPGNYSFINRPVVKGSVEIDASIHLCMDCTIVNNQIVGSQVEIVDDGSGKWTYYIPEITNGNHTIYYRAVDKATNQGPIGRVDFTYDSVRPIIKPSILPKQDMTRVALDSIIVIELSEHSPIDTETITNGITLTRNGIDVKGVPLFISKENQLRFTPEEPLLPSTTYLVSVNNTLRDIAGNKSLPRFWSFTTISDPKIATDNPHGSYQSNVNTCRNCHGTHISTDVNLMDQKVLPEPKKINDVVVDNYCMACHDGTVAPIASGALATSHTHEYGLNKDFSINKGSCSGCHNPHLEWSEDNPNILADHFSYQHVKPENIELIPENIRPNYDAPISNREQLCESCHERGSISKAMNGTVEYSVFQYKKWHTAEGIVDDYELCLRCHNANYQEKNIEISNIADFYNNLTSESKKQFEEMNKVAFSTRDISSQEKQFSGHIVKALDGSPLAGHIPCAECHDTHGSNNIMQLKEKLGHENKGEFIARDGEWDTIKERSFCLSCHNGETGLYGIKIAKLGNLPNVGEKVQTGHNDDSTESCSSCHTESYDLTNPTKAYMEAAHAPKRIPNKTTTDGK
jgi:hypothetical protein